jgi:hypothetical protein
MTLLRAALLLAVFVGALGAPAKKRLIDHQRCTSIGAGPKAMADGST